MSKRAQPALRRVARQVDEARSR